MDGGFVADGELVVARGHSAVAFEAVDPALDGVALFVNLGLFEAAVPTSKGPGSVGAVSYPAGLEALPRN